MRSRACRSVSRPRAVGAHDGQEAARRLTVADVAAGVPTLLVDALLAAYGAAAEQGRGGADISAVATAFAVDREG